MTLTLAVGRQAISRTNSLMRFFFILLHLLLITEVAEIGTRNWKRKQTGLQERSLYQKKRL
jgi:hypothetical protein